MEPKVKELLILVSAMIKLDFDVVVNENLVFRVELFLLFGFLFIKFLFTLFDIALSLQSKLIPDEIGKNLFGFDSSPYHLLILINIFVFIDWRKV